MLAVVTLLTLLVTGVLIPVLMKRNTNQHNVGKEERSVQTEMLTILLENQGEIKADVRTIKKVNTELKETVLEHGREIKRISGQLNKD